MLEQVSNFIDGWGSGGIGSMQDIGALRKALETGNVGIVAAGDTGAAALRVQSLEPTLKRLSFQAKHCVGWNLIPKVTARSVAEEYTQLSSYGQTGDGFTPEITSPAAVDEDLVRAVAMVRFMAVGAEVSLATQFVQNVAPIMALKAQNATLLLLRLIETALWEGSTAKNPLAWNGIGAQIEAWAAGHSEDAEIVVDLRAQPFTPEVFEDACATIVGRYGQATHAFFDVPTNADLAKQMYSQMRWERGRETPGGVNDKIGVRYRAFESQTTNDRVQIYQNPMLQYVLKCPTAAVGKNCPAMPVVTTATGAHVGTLLDADTYYYKVIAIGQSGRSAPSTADTQAVNGAQDAVLTIVNPADTIYFEIWRSIDNAAFYKLDSVPCSTTGTTTYTDDGSEIAGCSKAYIGELESDQVIAFHKLTDLMKLDIAPLGTASRFLMLLYGVPIVYNCRRWVEVKNIGRWTTP